MPAPVPYGKRNASDIGRGRSLLCAAQAIRRAIGNALALGEDPAIPAAEQHLPAVQRQALGSVHGFGAKLVQRWFPAHQSSRASA
jgi:hypothetical protein